MKKSLLLRLEPELREKLRELAKAERRSMTSLILVLIEKKIEEVKSMKGGQMEETNG